MTQQKAKKTRLSIDRLLHTSLATPHTRIVTCGLLVGIVFSPLWLYDVVVGTFHGSASLILVAASVLGGYQLWTQRSQLAKRNASEEDQLLGHIIIVSGVGLAPFCFFSEWSQKLVWILILAGIALSSWGISFFKRYPMPAFLIGIGFFPQPTAVGKAVWDAFTPPEMLERFMAWSGGLGLQAIGHSATIRETIISLPGGSVRVDWGCSGFDMASIIAVASLVLGLFLKQSLPKVSLMVVIGIILALLSNVPRIMLMAMAEAYWGRESFEFWHGFWGGQIFSSILFTIYYYVVMAIVKGRSVKAKA
ncbi:exosortase/archaeosortase family protein [filamentous cyanobacterium CCP1]|nr:exosortase/archaeosortase family protein [filamentous cyanobacterium CCP2]PSB68364.1 exosortase/archaeosortase family protein [filamentous cyanobacterium CCP1]